MFKMLILQYLYNLAGEGIEYPVRDRLSFMRFLGLQLEDRVPDAKTVWLFRERLKDLKLAEDLFNRFHEQLTIHGYVARAAGQMIDATFAEAPPAAQQPGRERPDQGRQASRGLYSYKNHINADETEISSNLVYDRYG
jgi:IS5 family transposase